MNESLIVTGESHLNVAPKEQPPRNSQAKRTVTVITLESRLSLTEGVNLSGFKTDGVQKRVIMGVQKTALYNLL